MLGLKLELPPPDLVFLLFGVTSAYLLAVCLASNHGHVRTSKPCIFELYPQSLVSLNLLSSVAQAGLKLMTRLPILLGAWITGMCHHIRLK